MTQRGQLPPRGAARHVRGRDRCRLGILLGNDVHPLIRRRQRTPRSIRAPGHGQRPDHQHVQVGTERGRDRRCHHHASGPHAEDRHVLTGVLHQQLAEHPAGLLTIPIPGHLLQHGLHPSWFTGPGTAAASSRCRPRPGTPPSPTPPIRSPRPCPEVGHANTVSSRSPTTGARSPAQHRHTEAGRCFSRWVRDGMGSRRPSGNGR